MHPSAIELRFASLQPSSQLTDCVFAAGVGAARTAAVIVELVVVLGLDRALTRFPETCTQTCANQASTMSQHFANCITNTIKLNTQGKTVGVENFVDDRARCT
jgi:hypothetical protein